MKSLESHELSLHSFGYIEKNLTQLHVPKIPLTVPTMNENILINSSELHNPRAIVVETDALCRSVLVRRNDKREIQVMQADESRDTYASTLFRHPLEYMVLSQSAKFTWLINTAEDNVNDVAMLREFVGILSTFALGKQTKMKTT